MRFRKLQVSLITLTRSEVPAYLHQSELYKNLSDAPDECLTVPTSCFKKDLTLTGAPELENLLLTLRFWILTSLPDELITFLLKPLGKNVKKVLLTFGDHDLPGLKIINKIRDQPRRQACNIAAEHGDVALLDYFARQGVSINQYTLRIAAENGHLNCLTYIHHALEQKRIAFPYKDFVCPLAVSRGYVDCVKFLVEHGMPIQEQMCMTAAEVGYSSLLKYLLKNSNYRSDLIVGIAARYGKVACLQCAVERGCPVTESTWLTAVFFPECLQYLLQFHATPNTSVSVHAPGIARAALSEVLTPQLSLEACRRGALTSMYLLQSYNCPLHADMVIAAARGGNIECLLVLAELGFDCWVPSTVAEAAGAGQLQLVQQLNEMGCPWHDSAPVMALMGRKADCLEYLINERGVPTVDSFTWLLDQTNTACRLVVNARKQRDEDRVITESFWAQTVQESEEMGELIDVGFVEQEHQEIPPEGTAELG